MVKQNKDILYHSCVQLGEEIVSLAERQGHAPCYNRCSESAEEKRTCVPMQSTKEKRLPVVYWWLGFGLLLLTLFGLYSLLVSSGRLIDTTLRVEQALLTRPLTRFDCVARQWKYLGEAQVSLLLALGLCGLCLLLGYRKRAALVVLLLLGLGIGAEYLGKEYIAQPMPFVVQRGMAALTCPQMPPHSSARRVALVLGMWWVAPAPSDEAIQTEQRGASANIYGEDAYNDYGYPSGHAIRWMFLGLIACWLAWRQAKWRALRWALMTLSLLLAFGGGFDLFFTGGHLFTDLIGGYLLGASLATFTIAVLYLCETRGRRRSALSRPASQPGSDVDQPVSTIAPG